MHRRALRAVVSTTGLVAGLLAGISGMASAQAQPIVNIACGDIAGLDAAITAADAGTGPSTIVLATGCVYTLTTAAATGTSGPDGLPIVTNTVTLIGRATTIQRDVTVSDFRIAEVDSGGTLTVQGIAVRYGAAALGGCYLASSGGTLILKKSEVIHCTATSAGGGIYAEGGAVLAVRQHAGKRPSVATTVEIDRSSLVGNSAGDEGGAIFSASGSAFRLSIDYLARNTATVGGAIFNDGLGMFVGASDLTTNHASAEGGGIYNAESQLQVAGSKLELNSAGVQGGAMSNYGLSLLQNSVADSNTAPAGGGIWQGGGSTVALVSAIVGNLANNCRPLASVPGCSN